MNTRQVKTMIVVVAAGALATAGFLAPIIPQKEAIQYQTVELQPIGYVQIGPDGKPANPKEAAAAFYDRPAYGSISNVIADNGLTVREWLQKHPNANTTIAMPAGYSGAYLTQPRSATRQVETVVNKSIADIVLGR